MTTWQAIIKSKNGREMGRFDIEDIRAYVDSLNSLGFTRLGPCVWADKDGSRTVLEAVLTNV